MNRSSSQEFAAILHSDAAGVLTAVWRARLQQAWKKSQDGDAAVILDGSWGILRHTLEALSTLEADEVTIIAAIVFLVPGLQTAVIPDASVSLSECKSVEGLLDGQEAAEQVWALHAGQNAGRNGEGLRRLLLAIVQDVRVVSILLSRQLARLREAAHIFPSEQRRLAQLTHDIHAPLANRLGIWQLKWELEDLSLRYLEPVVYKRIARDLDERRKERESYIRAVVKTLSETLEQQDISAQVSGRPKHIYSIWRKMQKKNLAFDQLYDLRAVRILVEDIKACYTALGLVHALWVPVPSEFDDYIARPKANQYRSLHTAVVGPEGRIIEIQIRTHQMHAQAELGVAAHWKYKEGTSVSGDGFDRKIAWMRQLLDQGMDGEGGELAGALDSELAQDRTYVLTPKGDVVDLPKGATPLDFAYHIHTMVGHRCRGAKVNQRIVPLTYQLRSGDQVEILTARNAEPRRDWLLSTNAFLACARSRDKVRAWFRKLDRVRNIHAGKDLLERELRRLGVPFGDTADIVRKLHLAGLEELYTQLALGELSLHTISRIVLESDVSAPPSAATAPSAERVRVATRIPQCEQTEFTVEGVSNLVIQIAQCCQPVLGEAISGYLTRHRGITVHRPECPAFIQLSARAPQRVLPVQWGRGGYIYAVHIAVIAVDRRNLLKDITNLIAQEDAFVVGVNSGLVRKTERVRLHLHLKVRNHEQLSILLGRIEVLPGVQSVRRVGTASKTS